MVSKNRILTLLQHRFRFQYEED